MDEIVKDFLIESSENLDRLDQDLVKLESTPSSKELLASIFRTIHTIKGSCGFLGFAKLEKVAHAGESLLSKLRDGELALNAEITSGLLAMVDAVRFMLAKIQETEHDGEDDFVAVIAHLSELQSKSERPDAAAAPPASQQSSLTSTAPTGDDNATGADPQQPPRPEPENCANSGARTEETAGAPPRVQENTAETIRVVERENGITRMRTHQAARENFCRPSVDVLFRSVASVYGGRALAIILTGMGQDGLKGCEALRAQGARVYVQDEASSVVWGMPGFVAKAGLADKVLPLHQIGPELVRAATVQGATKRS
jgi:chemotaxis protein histidine kinase CheA